MTLRKGLRPGLRSYDIPENTLSVPADRPVPWKVTARITLEVIVNAQTPAMAKNEAYAKASQSITGKDISVVEIELIGFKRK